MARPKQFDRDEALEAAINVFRENGFAGASAAMLTDAMQIGRQSLYDTFGDKWQLYCASLQHYVASDTRVHVEALRSRPRAIDALAEMLDRVVAEADQPCLGVGSICEFGDSCEELSKLRVAAERTLRAAVHGRIREAQAQGDIAAEVDADEAAAFLLANVAAVRIAARGGAGKAELSALRRLALRALR